jgi:hypothetical protein
MTTLTNDDVTKLAFIKKVDENGNVSLVACPSDFKVGTAANISDLTVTGNSTVTGIISVDEIKSTGDNTDLKIHGSSTITDQLLLASAGNVKINAPYNRPDGGAQALFYITATDSHAICNISGSAGSEASWNFITPDTSWKIGLDNSPTIFDDGFSIKTTNSADPEFYIHTDGKIGMSSVGVVAVPTLGDVTIGNGALADGDIMLTLNSDRAWSFQQDNNGSSAKMRFVSHVGNKDFIIATTGMTKFYSGTLNNAQSIKFEIDNETGDNNTYGGTKNFNIDHPTRPNYRLVHTSIEGPLCDLIYRGKITLVDSEAVVDVDNCFGMSVGTFSALTKNPQVFLQNTSGWAPVRVKSFSGAILTIESNSSDNDEISWMVVATRNDAGVYRSHSTDENGDLIVEFEEPDDEDSDE